MPRPFVNVLGLVVVAGALSYAQSPARSDLALLSVDPAPASPPGTRYLEPPAGARMAGSSRSGGGSGDTFTTELRLETTMTGDEVASHYAAQLQPPSWQRDSTSAAAGLLSVTRFSGRMADGTPVTAQLVVTKVERGQSMDVALRLLRGSGTAFAPAGPPPPPPPYGREGGAGASANITGLDSIANLLFASSNPLAAERSTIQPDAPATFPVDLLPGGARVIAASVSESRTLALALAPALQVAELPKFAAGLTKSGWLTAGFPTFLNASLTSARLRACRDSSSALMEFLPRSGGGYHVRVTLTASSAPCRQRYPEFAGIVMPLLVLPASATMPGWGERVSAAPTFESSGNLHTVVIPSVLATDFADQMLAQGWKPGGTAGQPNSFSAARFTASGSTGSPTTSVLVLTTLPGRTLVDAWVRVLR